MEIGLYKVGSKLLVGIGCISALAACGETKNVAQKAKETDVRLAGNWENECGDADWLGLLGKTSNLKFSALGDYERTTTIFSGKNCSTSEASFMESGTYQALGGSKLVKGADEINFSTTTATVTPDAQNGVAALNKSKYCGFSDWKIGESKDILDLECLGRDFKKGEVLFDLYQLTNDDKTLNLGKSSFWLDKSGADERPEKIDANEYSRQK